MNTTGLENVAAFQGVEITVVGMIVVVCGLVTIALFLAALPRVLNVFEKKETCVDSASSAKGAQGAACNASAHEGEELYAAIAFALHLELEASGVEDTQIITIRRETPQHTLWSSRGKLRDFTTRRKHA